MKKVFLLLALIMMTTTATAEDLSEVMEVLKYVETLNDPNAIGDGGDSYGVLQIQAACVADVNRYYGTEYTHDDMFNVACAEEVFKLYSKMGIKRYIKKYGVAPTTEMIVRNWNGGIYQGYRINATRKYYREYVKWSAILKSENNVFNSEENHE
jgi:hypothetical protein